MEAAAKLLRIDATVKIDTGPGKHHRGCTFWDGSQYVIWIKPNSFFAASDFAHELGHILLGHISKVRLSPYKVESFLAGFDGKLSAEAEEREKEADRVGGYIIEVFKEFGIKF